MTIKDERMLTSLVGLLINKPDSDGADIVRTLVDLKPRQKVHGFGYQGTVMARSHAKCECGSSSQFLGVLQAEYDMCSHQECVGLPTEYRTFDEYFHICLGCGQTRYETGAEMAPETFLDIDLDILAAARDLDTAQVGLLRTIQKATLIKGDVGERIGQHCKCGFEIYCGRVDLGTADSFHNFWHICLQCFDAKHAENFVRQNSERDYDTNCPFCGRRT